jgi:hypothetical protein
MVVNSEALERAIEAIVETNTAIEVDGDQIIVTGTVDSDEERAAVIETLVAYLPEAEIVDNLETGGVMPEEIGGLRLSESENAGFAGATPGLRDEESLEPGDFTDQSILYDPAVASGPSGTHSDDDVSEGDEVYVPPTDPPSNREGEFLGGFQTTADQDDAEVRSEVVPGPADGGLEDAVREELRQDAATTALEVRVASRNGVVHLRGTVDDIEDAENAQEVASRVPGVREVIEEFEVRNLRRGGA